MRIMEGKNVKILRLEKENIFEVTNHRKLGPSEIEQIQGVYDTVVKLIKAENKYPAPEVPKTSENELNKAPETHH